MMQLKADAMEAVVANSYRDFHAKGFDYLCLRRSPDLTVKLYFFDGDASKLSEVVNPHDHRYDFGTTCLSGEVHNSTYRVDDAGEKFQAFEYRTPLNGGNGFQWLQETRLIETSRRRYGADQSYFMRHGDVHTIRIGASETILMLRQYEDQVPLDGATLTFARGAAPSLEGLYSRMTADHVLMRLRQLQRVAGVAVEIWGECKDQRGKDQSA